MERIRKLAKSFALMEGETVALFRKDDGTYDFSSDITDSDKEIVEYITPY